MAQATACNNLSPLLTTTTFKPMVLSVGSGFVPAISNPLFDAERFPRKAKATHDEALAYAILVIWYRQLRERSVLGRIQAISHPRYSELEDRRLREDWSREVADLNRNIEDIGRVAA